MNDDGNATRGSGAAIVSPPGWSTHETVELAAPDLSAHVIATVEPIVTGTTVDELAGDYATVLERLLPDYSEVSIEPITLPDQRSAVMRVLRWTPSGGNEVTQLQMYSVEGNRACVGTATAQTAVFDRLQPDLRRALESIRIDPPHGVEMPAVRGGSEGVGTSDGSDPMSIPIASLHSERDASASMPVDSWSSIRERFGDA